jgi:cation diffusion facilitator CzcD-associated flavoprotein CzcO
MKDRVGKWKLDRDVKFSHRVVGAKWQERLRKWRVLIQHRGKEIEDFADILISGQGFLK